jgi:cytoskeleton protein RodZ
MEQVSLGTYLRNGRERAGVSLDGLSATTRVPRRSLEALEEERFVDLPAIVFVKGFVRAYCREVRLDPQPALDLLPSAAPSPWLGPAASPDNESAHNPIYLTAPTRDLYRGLRISRVILVLIAVALFAVAYIIAGSSERSAGDSTAAGGAPPHSQEHPAAPFDAGSDPFVIDN